jgi:hypothetical protein
MKLAQIIKLRVSQNNVNILVVLRIQINAVLKMNAIRNRNNNKLFLV